MSGLPEVPTLAVVAAVIRGADGRILIARRAAEADQGGLWEFPGGKLETGESQFEGLRRELREELGIMVTAAAPLLNVNHRYPHRHVSLHVFEVTAWRGEPTGCEGQPLRWVWPDELLNHAFPAANRPIVTAARLPRYCLITPEPGDLAEWLAQLDTCLRAGIQLVQCRAHSLSPSAYVALAREAVALVHARGGRILLNAAPELAVELGADGVHLGARRLRLTGARPMAAPALVSAACHNPQELALAAAAGADFVLISPVAPTSTHPGAPSLGWVGLASLAGQSSLPAYALGGMDAEALPLAVAAGCIGVAAISAAWQWPARMSGESARRRLGNWPVL